MKAPPLSKHIPYSGPEDVPEGHQECFKGGALREVFAYREEDESIREDPGTMGEDGSPGTVEGGA